MQSLLQTVNFFFFSPLANSLLQLGTMISTEPTVLEACGGLIPDPRDLRNLLLHQQAKGLLGVKGRFVRTVDETGKLTKLN